MVKTIEQTLYHLQLQIEEYYEPGNIIKLRLGVNKLSKKEELLKLKEILVGLGFELVGIIEDGFEGVSTTPELHLQIKRPAKFFHIGPNLAQALGSIGINKVEFWKLN